MKRTSRNFRRLFLDLSTLVIVGCGGGTDATPDSGVVGDAGVDSSILTESFPDHVCTLPAGFQPLASVTETPASDYLRLQMQYDAPLDPNVATIAERGNACATATDVAVCNSKLAAVRSAEGWVVHQQFGGPDMAPNHRYLVSVKGDEIKVVSSVDALRTFLAPFDVADGAFLLSESGYRFKCEEANARKVEGGTDYVVYSGTACGADTRVDRSLVRVSPEGVVTVVRTEIAEVGNSNCAIGRRPEGFCLKTEKRRSIGQYFAEAASLEAASVPAFRRLASEMRAAKAPRRLALRADQAARDEVAHARVTARLAKKYGAKIARVARPKFSERRFIDMVLENAVEGCVRETFGALVMTVQSQRVTDADLARTFAKIALDETKHAELAWDVAKYCEGRLSEGEQRRVGRARKKAVRELRAEISKGATFSGDRLLGLPNREESLVLLDAMIARMAI